MKKIFKMERLLAKYVELNKSFDELIVRIGSQKRHILLPRHLAAYNVINAKLDNHYLNIIFEGEDHDRQNQ